MMDNDIMNDDNNGCHAYPPIQDQRAPHGLWLSIQVYDPTQTNSIAITRINLIAINDLKSSNTIKKSLIQSFIDAYSIRIIVPNPHTNARVYQVRRCTDRSQTQEIFTCIFMFQIESVQNPETNRRLFYIIEIAKKIVQC